MKSLVFRLAVLLLPLATYAQAAGPLPAPAAALSNSAEPDLAKPAQKAGWVFSLLPKSMQENPYLDFTVVTEMTPEGKKLPPVTPAQPAFYQVESAGYRSMGDSGGNQFPVAQPEVERLLTAALKVRGYHPANPPAQAPTIAIFYAWGTHNLIRDGADAENSALSGAEVAANMLNRARLVGGEKFALRLADLFGQANDLELAARTRMAPGALPVLDASAMALMNPVHQFKNASPKNASLMDQAANDIYYIVASAYDYRALTAKERKLLWRTSMTVSSDGVAEDKALPVLIASAAPYLGREMTESEVLTKRMARSGTVKVGTPTVVPSKETKPNEKK